MIPGLRLRSFGEVFETFWDSLSVILSDTISRVPKHSLERLLTGLWLLANTVLISIYSGELYNVLISSKVIDKIESIEELHTKHHWKGSKILMLDLGIMDIVVNGDKGDPVVNDLSSRAEAFISPEILTDSQIMKDMIKSVFIENNVIIANKLSIYYVLRKFQNEWTDFMSLFIEGTDYHVSEPQRSSMPYHFMYVREMFDEYHIKIFNQT